MSSDVRPTRLPTRALPRIADAHPGATGIESMMRRNLTVLTLRLADELHRARDGAALVSDTRWTVGELAAHLVSTHQTLLGLLAKRATAYGVPYAPSAEVDDQLVRETAERDPARLAAALVDVAADLELALASAADSQQLPDTNGLTVGLACARLVLDNHVHGSQLAELTGSTWRIEPLALRRALLLLFPAAFQPAARPGLRGVYALHLPDVSPLVFEVGDGKCTMVPSARADCHIHVRSVPYFLACAAGARRQWHGYVRGEVRVSGRHPWLARHLWSLFEPAPHGGLTHAGPSPRGLTHPALARPT